MTNDIVARIVIVFGGFLLIALLLSYLEVSDFLGGGYGSGHYNSGHGNHWHLDSSPLCWDISNGNPVSYSGRVPLGLGQWANARVPGARVKSSLNLGRLNCRYPLSTRYWTKLSSAEQQKILQNC